MSSYETDAIYELLLKRYKEKRFLKPEAALNVNIRELIGKGRTREEAIRELYSSDSPWIYSPAPLSDASQEKVTERDTAVIGQIANLREKIDSLTALFSKGEISEETYLRGVKKIEEDISGLQREHKIPIVRSWERTPTSVSRYALQETREEIEETRNYGSPDKAWWLVPFLFGILGGIVAYVAVKDDDREMADNLLIFGILWTVALAILGWLLLLD